MRSFVLLILLSCSLQAHAAPVLSGRVLGENGKGVADAVVFVQSPIPGDAGAAAGSHMAAMDQIDKTFVPGLLPIMVGTKVKFPNHDQIHHHVYSFSRTKSFELPLYKGEDAPPVLFDKVGVVKVGCNIHDWMSGIILVLPTPWFAVTDAEGHFALNDLPHGRYTLVAWHELSKLKPEQTEQSVQVGANTTDLNFMLPLSPARARPAVHGTRREP
ncbi:MAG: hypothetical protein ABI885_07940 [Gammaproteobacteria bacterium]